MDGPAERKQSAQLTQVAVQHRRKRRRSERRSERRRMLLLAIAMPIILIVAIFLEDSGLPNFTPGYDLSETVIRWTAGISAPLGRLAIIVSGLRHGVRGLYPVSRGPGQWRRAIRRAREQRLRAAARMVAGALIAFFGLAVLIARLGAV